MPLAKKFIIIDTETTDLVENGGRLAEIAMVYFETDDSGRAKIINKFESLVNPESDFSEAAKRVNGLDLEMLSDKPKFAEIADRVFEYLNIGVPVLAYNSTFDLKILSMEFSRLERKMPHLKVIDIFFLAKQKIKPDDNRLALLDSGRRSFSQTSVAKLFELDTSGSHRAMADVKILFFLYKNLVDLPDISKFKDKKTADEDRKAITKSFSIDLIKDAVIKNLSDVSIAKIATRSIVSMKRNYDLSRELIEEANTLSVSSTDESIRAIDIIGLISKLKTKIAKERQEILSPLKKVTQTIEFLYREYLLAEIESAQYSLSENRSSYLHKKYEEEKDRIRFENERNERLAQEKGQKVFDKLKAVDLNAAIEDSLKEYQKELNLLKDQVLVSKTKATTASSKDEFYFDIEIIDESVIPDFYWSPDKQKILDSVIKHEGRIIIPGVSIITKLKSRITNKRG